ncbi:2OG-Fe(II) oxygenase [Lentzea sp. PSKA42]|uniref:2OG-Fe(II) oxygenase n=1 Tax=Lentzea indica TaxID=2604800 RepID=A0ABX1FCN5_9PSEU|nr:2OG-Fe(II) oxygenase [Lentzea indica]NKE56721.1 2OG-Fe(II) oxygenase [Lentzea indica]
MVTPGDRAPLFAVRTEDGGYWFSEEAGQRVILSFVDELDEHLLAAEEKLVWVVPKPCDPPDDVTVIVDDGQIATAYGIGKASALLDANLRVEAIVPQGEPIPDVPDIGLAAPVLTVPRVLEPEFCQELVAHYERQGGQDSGFMRTDDQGRTATVHDHAHKRRQDLTLEDPLRQGLKDRVERRLIPEIQRAFQFRATRVERWIIACYEAETGGHFKAHRDNTTKGTAHRRFAVTINLNDDFEGGELRFPEYGRRTYRARPGDALVFSCSLLHEVTPVTTGRRFCTLPFLHDEAAEQIRLQNLDQVLRSK